MKKALELAMSSNDLNALKEASKNTILPKSGGPSKRATIKVVPNEIPLRKIVANKVKIKRNLTESI